MMASLVALFQTSTKLALVGGMLLDGYEVPPVHHAVPAHRKLLSTSSFVRVSV